MSNTWDTLREWLDEGPLVGLCTHNVPMDAHCNECAVESEETARRTAPPEATTERLFTQFEKDVAAINRAAQPDQPAPNAHADAAFNLDETGLEELRRQMEAVIAEVEEHGTGGIKTRDMLKMLRAALAEIGELRQQYACALELESARSDQLETAEARIRQLEEALRQIANTNAYSSNALYMLNIARSALSSHDTAHTEETK